MSDEVDDRQPWRATRVRGSSGVRRWRPIVVGPKVVLGIDEDEEFLLFVSETNELIPADDANMLFFLPLLDMDRADFFARLADVLSPGAQLQARADDLVQVILQLALRQRATTYIERALGWLHGLSPNERTRDALRELTRSKRGTQNSRQRAAKLLGGR